MMAGEQRLCMALYAAALVANIVLNVVLIPLLGLNGAAIATTGAMIIEAILLFAVVRHKMGITLFAFASPSGRSNGKVD